MKVQVRRPFLGFVLKATHYSLVLYTEFSKAEKAFFAVCGRSVISQHKKDI